MAIRSRQLTTPDDSAIACCLLFHYNCPMKKYDVYGIGNALVDIVTEVEHDFFEKNTIEKGS